MLKEIKDIMKVIRSLQNRRISLKGTTRKLTSQERGFFNFLGTLRLTATALVTDAAIQKKIWDLES